MYLTAFGEEALDHLAGNDAASKDGTIRTALLYYLSDRGSGRAAWRAPRLGRLDGAPRTRVRIALDHQTLAEISDEASRQDVKVEELAAHAFAYFLADLEAGRLPARLAARLDDES